MNTLWYDVNETLSHNCLFNFIVGPRGVGKTYSAKRRAIRNYLRRGGEFVYLRRYQTELKQDMLANFFADVEREHPDHDYKYAQGRFWIDGKCAGYALSLSKAAQYKSTPFPKVELIIFDEFIIDQGMIRYLPNEVQTFNEMYSTIARLRDVPVLFLANAITFTNPYFLFFGLSLRQNQRIVKKGDILLQWVENIEYSKAANETRFGRIVAGTSYGYYAMENVFLRDTDTFIEPIRGASVVLYNLILDDCEFGVCRARGSDMLYVSDTPDKTASMTISLDTQSHNQDTILKQSLEARLWLAQLREAYYRGEVRFTSVKAKNLVTQFMKNY